jgi:hypothetical protein
LGPVLVSIGLVRYQVPRVGRAALTVSSPVGSRAWRPAGAWWWRRWRRRASGPCGACHRPAGLGANRSRLAALAASAWLVRGCCLSFALAFALAFALLYLGRPAGWTLVYLDLVVGVAAWPSLSRVGRAALLVGVVALLASHWAALVLTGLGDGLPLLTLQPADRPWET